MTILENNEHLNGKLMRVLAHTKIAGIVSQPIDLALLLSGTESERRMAELERLIKGMVRTCVAEDGLGLAAPQVGFNKALFVGIDGIASQPTSTIDSSTNQPQRLDISYTAYLNPSWTTNGDDTEKETDKEGCLSVKTTQPLAISRYRSITASWYEIDFNTKQIIEMRAISLSGLRARLFQHECEHLRGGNIVATHKKQLQQQNKNNRK